MPYFPERLKATWEVRLEREMDVRSRSTLNIIPRSLEFVNGAVEAAESLSQGMA